MLSLFCFWGGNIRPRPQVNAAGGCGGFPRKSCGMLFCFSKEGRGDVLRLRDYDVKSLVVFGLCVEKKYLCSV